MYYKLFTETSKAIEALQKAQQDCERMFMDAKDIEMFELPKPSVEKEKNKEPKDRDSR